MRQLLNTLFVTSEDAWLSLDGENVLVNREKEVIGRYPLHILQGIVCFSYAGASPALMGACAERGVALSFCTPRGKFLARTCGRSSGNVLLRRMQYRVADDPAQNCRVARCSIFGKVYNARWSVERTLRDHGPRVDVQRLSEASRQLKEMLPAIGEETGMESLRGLEGAAATVYFGVLDEMILRNKEAFTFSVRSRRPPLDPVNALLSFVYTLLGSDCAAALETAGLDSYVGFLHRDRPGRTSLALDLMEGLRRSGFAIPNCSTLMRPINVPQLSWLAKLESVSYNRLGQPAIAGPGVFAEGGLHDRLSLRPRPLDTWTL